MSIDTGDVQQFLRIIITYCYNKGNGWEWYVHLSDEKLEHEFDGSVALPRDGWRWGTTLTKWGAKRQVRRCVERLRSGRYEGYTERIEMAVRTESDLAKDKFDKKD